MKTLLVQYKIALIVAAALIVGGGAWWYVGTNTAPAFKSLTVSKGNVVESVNVPANVLTEHSAALSFQEGGQIASVDVHEGTVVAQGQVLATLDTASLQAAVQEADAAVAAAQAKLDALTSGTRPQQLQIDENAVASASTSLGIAVSNAYTASNDAILNQTDNLFANPKTSNPVFLVPVANSQTTNDLSAARVQIGADLASWYAALSASSTDPASLAGTANHVLQEIHAYLNTIALAVNGAPAAAAVTPSTLASYKAYESVATTEIAGSINAVAGAQAALTQAQGALALAQAGTTSQDIEAQQAVVAQAQAADTAAHVTLANATLAAPFPGTVQGLTAQVGQVVSPGAPLMTLVNQSGLKIEAYVSQTDVAKIAVGDKANVTLNAYGTGTVFPAVVTTVDPGETQVNGTAAYLVTLHFTGTDSRVKDGMNGNVQIIVAEHNNVVEVPTNLVITNDTSSFVLVSSNGKELQQPVTTGLVGDNGMTEITSGLSAGETIVNF
jgi:HlyD family secretion protein